MFIEDGLAYIDMPLTVRQLEEVLGMIDDKDRVVVVSDETLAHTGITAVDFGSGRAVENVIHARQILCIDVAKGARFGNAGNSKKVDQFLLHKDGTLYLLATYTSIKSASLVTGFEQTFIGKCCRGESPQAYGYIWNFHKNKD